jgi:hypothetical protein
MWSNIQKIPNPEPKLYVNVHIIIWCKVLFVGVDQKNDWDNLLILPHEKLSVTDNNYNTMNTMSLSHSLVSILHQHFTTRTLFKSLRQVQWFILLEAARLKQILLKQGYVAPRLKSLQKIHSGHHACSWTGYLLCNIHFSNGNGCFHFSVDFFVPSSPTQLLSGLTMSDTISVL